jgi:hypothetical protein
MTTTSSQQIKSAGKKAGHDAQRAARKPWVILLARWGYVVRGFIYIVIGVLALRLATGSGGETTDPTGALDFISQQPYGKVMMIVVIAGLVGYSLWGFVRALLDPLGRGTDTKGLTARGGYLLSGISYGALVFPAVRLLQNKPAGAATGGQQSIVTKLLGQPAGVWLVAAFGIFWIVSAIAQWQQAYTANFMGDLKTGKMSADEEKLAERLGRIGYAARGVVYALIGWFALQAAATLDAFRAQGIAGALHKLAQQPYGLLLLGLVSFGLVIFGLFSVMCARWYKTGPRPTAR